MSFGAVRTRNKWGSIALAFDYSILAITPPHTGRLPLLLELVHQGSTGARHILYGCLAAKDFALHNNCPFAVAVFDRQRALDWLAGQLKDRDRNAAAQAAQSLVHLGERQGIPILIDELASEDSTRRSLAYDTLKHFTQQDIPYDPNGQVAARTEASGLWRQWWQENKDDFNVRVRAAQTDSEVFL